MAIDELEVGAESASAIGAPGGRDRALGGEALGVLEEMRLDPVESGEGFLVTRVGFFRVGGGLARFGQWVLVTRVGFFRVGGPVSGFGGGGSWLAVRTAGPGGGSGPGSDGAVGGWFAQRRRCSRSLARR